MLQGLEVAELFADLQEFFLQAKADGATRLQGSFAQGEKLLYFLERKSQTLSLANESQSFDVRLVVLPEAACGSRRTWEQGAALVKADGVRGEADFLCQATDVHWSAPSQEHTPWTIVLSQGVDSSGALGRALSLGAKAEVEDFVMRSFLALRTGEWRSACCHLRFGWPSEGVAYLVLRRLYLPVSKLVFTFGATENPAWHGGIHDIRNITIGIRKL